MASTGWGFTFAGEQVAERCELESAIEVGVKMASHVRYLIEQETGLRGAPHAAAPEQAKPIAGGPADQQGQHEPEHADKPTLRAGR